MCIHYIGTPGLKLTPRLKRVIFFVRLVAFLGGNIEMFPTYHYCQFRHKWPSAPLRLDC